MAGFTNYDVAGTIIYSKPQLLASIMVSDLSAVWIVNCHVFFLSFIFGWH